MFDYAKIALQLLKFVNWAAAKWQSFNDWSAGRNAAVLTGKEAAEKEEALAREEEAAPVDPDEPDEFMRK